MLKKEVSINNEKIIIWLLYIKIFDKLFVGKNPPDEIIVIAKFKELNILTSNMFRIIKIPNVIKEYKRKIFSDCFKVSALLNDIKLAQRSNNRTIEVPFLKISLRKRGKVAFNIDRERLNSIS